jgi:Kef-type K+ transport system membrane component KefB
MFRFGARESNYTTLLMSTGLTFGTISALFGLNNGYIHQEQYSVLVTVVIGSAIVPTMIAQGFFKPEIEPAVALEVTPPPPAGGGAASTDGAPAGTTVPAPGSKKA